jgi:hypothetical protein
MTIIPEVTTNDTFETLRTRSNLAFDYISNQSNSDVDTIVNGELTVNGSLVVLGTSTSVNSIAMTVLDPIITLGGNTDPSSDDNKDRGVQYYWHNSTKAASGFFGWDDSSQLFTAFKYANNTSEVISGTLAGVKFDRGTFANNVDITSAASVGLDVDRTGSDGDVLTISNDGTIVGSLGVSVNDFYIDSDGDSLILRVKGSDAVTIANNADVSMTNNLAVTDSVTANNLTLTDAQAVKWGDATTYIEGSGAADTITAVVASAAKLRINTTGVGVGKYAANSVIEAYANSADIAAGQILVEQNGTGDAAIKYQLTGGQKWFSGIDNSDSDYFKIGTNSLGSNTVISMSVAGNTGIGIDRPRAKLHVYSGNSGLSTQWASADDLIVEGSGATGISIFSPDAQDSTLGFSSPSDLVGAYIVWNHDANEFKLGPSKTSGVLQLLYGSSLDGAILNGNGNFGIATTTPAARLEVEDGGTAQSILVKITADDANPWGLIIGNDTFSTADTDGLTFAVDNSGKASLITRGTNSEMGLGTEATEFVLLDNAQDMVLNNASDLAWKTSDGTKASVLTMDASNNVILGTPAGGGAAGRDLHLQIEGVTKAQIDNRGNIVLGSGAISNTATDGFMWIPSTTGVPTGTANASHTGMVPMMYDTTGDKIYFYNSGWQAPLPSIADTFADDDFTVTGSADATKTLKFEVDGISTGTQRTFTWPNHSGNVVTTNTSTVWVNNTRHNANVVMGPSASMQIDAGTAALPGLSFLADPTSGLYRNAANNLSLAISGTRKLVFGINDMSANSDNVYSLGTSATRFKEGHFAGQVSGNGMVLFDADRSTSITLQANGIQAVSQVWTLPVDAGTAGYALVTDGSAGSPTLSWSALKTFTDTEFSVTGDVDPTKVLKFQVDNISSGVQRTITWQNSSGTVALTNATNAWAGNQTHYSYSNWIDGWKVRLGTGSDMELYHNGTDNYIALNNGNLKIVDESDNLVFEVGKAGGATLQEGNLTLTAGAVLSSANGTYDIGSTTKHFQDGFFQGQVTSNSMVLYDADRSTSVTLEANGVTTTSYTMRMPNGVGLSGQALLSDGNNPAQLTWGAPSTTGQFERIYNCFAMVPTTTNGAGGTQKHEMRTGDDMAYRPFDSSSQEYCTLHWPAPKSWDESTIEYRVIWMHPVTATNYGVAFDMSAKAMGNSDQANSVYGTAVTVTDTGGAANTIYDTGWSSSITVNGTPAENDLVNLQFSRDPANGSDNLAVDAWVVSVIIRPNFDQGTDD